MLEDDFDFLKLIGKGKYGEVWQVVQKSTKTSFAVKKLELLGQSEDEHVSLRREAELLSRLSHPNIVACQGYFEVPGSHLCIVMQYCDGGDLRSHLQQQEGELILENQVMEWFIQVCMAIQYLHAQHILHRDLKTQNIFLTKKTIIKLGDFGIARSLQNGYDMAETFIGTPYYMSPELFANKPYNSKTDMWSLGCCLHEMMTLKYAFTASSLPALMKIIAKGQIPALPKKYSQNLRGLCKQLLNPKPPNRPSANKVLGTAFVKTHIKCFIEENRKTSSGWSETEENTDQVSKSDDKRLVDATDRETVPKGATSTCTHLQRAINIWDQTPEHSEQNLSGQQTEYVNDTPGLIACDTNTPVTPTEAGSSKPKTVRKKKRFLKDRARASQVVESQCVLPSMPSQKKPTKPRRLPMPPITAAGEPVHRKEMRRVPVEGDHPTDQLSDSSLGSHPPGSSTSGSSLEEVRRNVEESGIPLTARSSTNFKARRKRREKNSMAVSSSIEMIRLHGIAGTARISPPETLHTSGPLSTPGIVFSAEPEGGSFTHPAFRGQTKQESEESAAEIRTMTEVLNEALITDMASTSEHNGCVHRRDLIDASTESFNGNFYEDLNDNRHKWIEDEPPDIDQKKTERYIALREECSSAIGPTLFYRACQIIETEPEDSMEMQLVDLLGQHKYEEYALKIWQLKFLRETMDTGL